MEEWIGVSLKYDPTRRVPDSIIDKVLEVKRYMEMHDITSIHGFGDVNKAKRQLREELSKNGLFD